jgi:hypothetical protein
MILESITSYVVLTSILIVFGIGLLSIFLFPFFMDANEKLNEEYQ